jgi:hypothetical protein
MPQNIDDFETGVALIFGMLYENFPKEIELNPYDLAIISTMKLGHVDDDINSRCLELSQIYCSTARFLLAEGYIRGNQTKGRTCTDNCALTIKGLIALQRVPKSMQDKKKSIGDFFLDLGKDGVKEVTKEVLTSAVRALLSS